MAVRKPLVVGNWKMNGNVVENARLLSALHAAIDAPMLAHVDVALCPPFVYLAQVVAMSHSGLALGAQNVAAWHDGAYTGEVSAVMLADVGCKWVLVGHSERRALLGETDATVAAKAARALEAGVGVIACVGETLQERESGTTDEVIARQVAALVGLMREIRPVAADAAATPVVIAYEPVWAIGSGRTASPEQAQAVHAQIRNLLREAGASADTIRLLYGGSVKPGNAVQLFSQPDIDGGLIGGAALVADDFVAICRAAQTRHQGAIA
jgi:triosephosphate isomerase